MKKRKHIGLWVILFLLVVISVLGLWQRENIRAAIIYLRTDETSSAQKMEENRDNIQNVLKEQYNITILTPSLEQSDALLSGTISPEEVKESLGLPQKLEDIKKLSEPSQSEVTKEPNDSAIEPEETKEPPSETPKTEETKESAAPVQTPEGETEEQKPSKTPQMIVDECVAELYAAEIDLMAVLGTMKQAAIDEWSSLPDEQHTPAKKKKIILDGLNQCYVLEVEIDSLVKSILDKYRAQMKEINGDLTVFDTLWNYYCDEKASTKAYYMNKYL